MDIPLPEIQADDFERSWLRFELVAKAKEWDQAKQLAILPTLLHGKLLDHYVCLSDDEKRDAGTLKTALMKHAGHPLADTLLASRMFGERTQGPKETVSDYVSDLKKLFKLAHPTEAEDSVVLLHKFITGLQRGISQQLLMKGLPASLADALKTALEVEYAFTFGAQQLQIQHNSHGEDPIDAIGTWASETSVSFKLQGAKPGGERSLANTTLTHQLCTPSLQKPSINAVLQVMGTIDQSKTKFLIDSGAAVSVIHLKRVPGSSLIKETPNLQTVGANGAPLDIVGQTTLVVGLGTFQVEQEFVVARSLSVDCLLGADFLTKHGAVIDFKRNAWKLDGGVVEIPLSADIGRLCHVVTNKTVEVPARTVVLLEAALSESQGNYTEGLVEPLEGKEGIPKCLLVARALVTAVNNRVIMQVMNTGTAPAKLHCGMKLSMFSPRTTIHVVDVDDEVHPSTSPQQSAPLNFDLEESHLNEKQQKELKSVLCSFKDIFSGTGDPLGRTNVVKHAIKMQGPPIRQPMRRLPIVMKDVVNQEVEGMLNP
eukprot:Em0007g1187a